MHSKGINSQTPCICTENSVCSTSTKAAGTKCRYVAANESFASLGTEKLTSVTTAAPPRPALSGRGSLEDAGSRSRERVSLRPGRGQESRCNERCVARERRIHARPRLGAIFFSHMTRRLEDEHITGHGCLTTALKEKSPVNGTHQTAKTGQRPERRNNIPQVAQQTHIHN